MGNSYAYKARDGIRPISWERFYGLCKGLALQANEYKPDIIVGIARGGLYPATQLSHLLQIELQAVRLTRRVNDKVVRDKPEWIQEPTDAVRGKRVLVVDEICDSGETLRLVKERLSSLEAERIKIAVLYAHAQASDICDYAGIITDELILNPWDREVVINGRFVVHPEYEGALREQGVGEATEYVLPIKTIKPAKG